VTCDAGFSGPQCFPNPTITLTGGPFLLSPGATISLTVTNTSLTTTARTLHPTPTAFTVAGSNTNSPRPP
jgi:hypothetical protein